MEKQTLIISIVGVSIILLIVFGFFGYRIWFSKEDGSEKKSGVGSENSKEK